MQISDLIEPFTRLLDTVASPAAVRGIERGGTTEEMWSEIRESGYLDALVSEDRGGSGLRLADVGLLVEAIGARAVPLPVAETVIARALLAEAGVAAPTGPVVLVSSMSRPVPCALVATHALVDAGEELVLMVIPESARIRSGVKRTLSARLPGPLSGPRLKSPVNGLRPIAAAIRASLIAGAAHRLTEMSAAYANDRSQFGKPIGSQQAVQQMLAVMAEDMIACRVAARMGLEEGLNPSLERVATAKITTSAAAARIAASAHAIHGAIGISEEYDLQLLTRRLHEWRLADGSETYWAGVLGSTRLGSRDTTLDWIRATSGACPAR